MSFRSRLTSFFVLIVVVPMVAIGFVVVRLISQSDSAKADARAGGLATVATSLYAAEQARAQTAAASLASAARSDLLAAAADPAQAARVKARLEHLAGRAGIVRVIVTVGDQTVLAFGPYDAIAPGSAALTSPDGSAGPLITVSTTTAAGYARDLTGQGAAVVIHNGRRLLASTLPGGADPSLPARGSRRVGNVTYRTATERFTGFGKAQITATILSDESVTGSESGQRVLAIALIAGFLLLAFGFSVHASRQLSAQVSRFLQAARRLGRGDFSAPVPTVGADEFAELGDEFNRMSAQLERRLEELRDAVRRTGQTFASNLDRPALLGLALQTAIDGTQANGGRLTSRAGVDDSLAELQRTGPLEGVEEAIVEAERAALEQGAGGIGEHAAGGLHVAAVALGPIDRSARSHGVITVCRSDTPFTDVDRDILRSLAAQTTLALENVRLHHQVQRQAVTDELTGLVNHRRFQEMLGSEIEQVRRYGHSVGLIMLDVDNFKRINDTHGHPQGDVVLQQVARVVQASSRDADTAARYGGEEMALVLPHTGLEGAHAIAERVRTAIESLEIPRLDHEGFLRVTASLGVAATTEAAKQELVAEADRALYEAKHAGKNRTVCASPVAANGRTGE